MFQNPLVLAIVGGVAVVGAIVTNIILWEDDDEVRAPQAEQAASAPAQEQPATAAVTEPKQKLETHTIANPAKTAVTAPEKPVPSPATAPAASKAPQQTEQVARLAPKAESPAPQPAIEKTTPPSFDVVRITPEGDAVIAGRATPGSQVIIIDNGQFVGQLETDKNGEWVFVPEKPFPPGSRQLGLEMRIEGKAPIPSDDVVVLVVPEPKRDIAGRKTDKPSAPLALKFPKKGGASTVLQKPSGDPGESILSVDTVDYDEDGRLMISGRAEPATSIFVYLDNQITGKVRTDQNGAWRMQPEERVEPGLYALRADQVADSGKVQARISIPFSRAQPMEEMPSEPFIIVQPGNSLWRIARKSYGSGMGFTTIYEANKDQITDPDLIFPGQVFALPSSTL